MPRALVDYLTLTAAVVLAFGAVVVGLWLDKPPLFAGWALLCLGVWTAATRWAPGVLAAAQQAMDRRVWATRAAGLALLVLFPALFVAVFRQPYWIHVACIAALYVCLALGLNIVVGLAGLLDLGYVAFFAIGAYAAALLSLNYPDVPGISLIAAALCAGLASVFGVGLGAPTLRLRGDYLAIVTLGFGEIIRLVLNNWDSVTNGPKGLFGIPPLKVAGVSLAAPIKLGSLTLPPPTGYYFAALVLAVGLTVLARRLQASRVGRAWQAIREDELAASAMGIHTRNLKLLAFACGAASAGLAGMLFAHLQTFVGPESFVFMESAWILCMVVLGGMGSIPGVAAGAVLLAMLPEKLRDFEEYRMLIFGGCLVAFMVLRPQGLFPARPGVGGRA